MNIEELKAWLKKHNELTKRRDLAMMELLDAESKMEFVSNKIMEIVRKEQQDQGEKCAA